MRIRYTETARLSNVLFQKVSECPSFVLTNKKAFHELETPFSLLIILILINQPGTQLFEILT